VERITSHPDRHDKYSAKAGNGRVLDFDESNQGKAQSSIKAIIHLRGLSDRPVLSSSGCTDALAVAMGLPCPGST
jgi:hypothetical protein